jgi:hypothetical protein
VSCHKKFFAHFTLDFRFLYKQTSDRRVIETSCVLTVRTKYGLCQTEHVSMDTAGWTMCVYVYISWWRPLNENPDVPHLENSKFVLLPHLYVFRGELQS